MNDKYKNTNAKQISTAKPDGKLSRHWLMMLGLLLGVFFGQALMTKAATFTVTKTTDTNDGACNADCSLREAIAVARTAAGDDTVDFAASLDGQTIVLTTEIAITSANGEITISGLGADRLTIDGGAGTNRVFYIASGTTVTINDVTITGGNGGGQFSGFGGAILTRIAGTILNLNRSRVTGNTDTVGGGGLRAGTSTVVNISHSTFDNNTGNAGAISCFASTVTITNTTISGNASNSSGAGGISASGGAGLTTLTITNSTVTNNTGVRGGGVSNFGATLTLTDSTISGNSASDFGGGIYSQAATTTLITSSTISGNSSLTSGGGIYNFGGTLTLTNSTVSGNLAIQRVGGGIRIYTESATATITNSTIANNTAQDYGGGIANGLDDGTDAGTVQIGNTIIADNSAPLGTDYLGPFTSLGYNLIENTSGAVIMSSGAGDIYNLDPKLGPLQGNGGPTETHALLLGSPAIDQGDSFGLTTDQRGLTRPFDNPFIPNAPGGDGADIGAFESQLIGPPANIEQCKNGGWQLFNYPRTFRNQGDCIQFVNTGR